MTSQSQQKRQKKQSGRKRRIKARTDVSSSSSSDVSNSLSSDSEGEITKQKGAAKKSSTKPASDSAPSASASPPSSSRESSPAPPSKPPGSTAVSKTDKAFTDFYLKQATREFAEDLDKLRSASDWRGQASLEMLIKGLRQGTGCFGSGEWARVGGREAIGAADGQEVANGEGR